MLQSANRKTRATVVDGFRDNLPVRYTLSGDVIDSAEDWIRALPAGTQFKELPPGTRVYRRYILPPPHPIARLYNEPWEEVMLQTITLDFRPFRTAEGALRWGAYHTGVMYFAR